MKFHTPLKVFGLLGLVAGSVLAGPASANYWHEPRFEGGHAPRAEWRPHADRPYASQIDLRQERQWSRIMQGVHSGALSPREVHALRQEQREIRHLERRFLADGHLSRHERTILNHRLDAASRHIRLEKHDGPWRH